MTDARERRMCGKCRRTVKVTAKDRLRVHQCPHGQTCVGPRKGPVPVRCEECFRAAQVTPPGFS